AYHTNNKPAFSCQIRRNENNEEFYHCFTNSQYFIIKGGEIIESGINGNKAIPVIEYPNNSRRISDIELTVGITDSLNILSSDRVNGIEQFICSFMKFINCEIDATEFAKIKDLGAISVKSNNGDNRADVDILSQELNQTEGQVVFDDLYNKFLEIHGLANRASVNSGGDTGNAVSLRNGYHESNLREAIDEPIIKKAERMTLRIILNRLRIKKGFTLMPSDIEIHINRDKLNNLMTKAETLQILLNSGIHYKRAIKTIGLFSDPEQVANESSKRMEILYPEEIQQAETNNIVETKVIE
ncbi:MAG: phage portal protein, partial [Succinivibrio sp.]|nr:phage portal protein [Succinivibrio sp.]